MPPKAASTASPPIIPALFFLAAAGAWPYFEYYAVQGYDGGSAGYDMTIESLSDLGVDYRQVHPLKHHNVTSHRFATQNFNFMLAGGCFGLAQLYLLYATRRRVTQETALLRTIRFVLTLLYVGGMVLLAQIHGGPREKFWKIIGWHWTGLTLAAVAGNLNSIIAAAVPNQTGNFEGNTIYRAISAVLGGAGLYSLYRFQTLGEWDFETKLGLWQRGIIYPVLAWEAVTAIMLVTAFAAGGSSKAKRP